MSVFRHYFLLYRGDAANGALLTLRKTGSGTGGGYRGKCLFGMSLSRNRALLYGDNAANGALLPLRKTGSGTGGGYRGKCLFGMSLCRNRALLYGDNAASGTPLALGKTGSGTSGCYCGNYFLGMSLSRNLVGNIAIITAKAGMGGISALGAGRLGYGSLVLMRAGGNGEIGCRTVGILKSGVILNLNLIAVLGEVKHSYHTLGALSVFSIHGLRVYEHLSHLVAVIADLLSNYYVVGIGVTANDHSDIGMLAQELVPKIVSRIVVGIVRGSVARLASLAESTVALEILVSGNDYAMIRMRCDNLVCPNENVILSSVVKTKKKIINRACLEGMINIVYSTLLVVAGDIARISLVIREVLVKELDAVVTVAANERVRNLAVHKADSLLSGSPLSVCSRLLIILVTYVNAVLGDVTKSDNVLNILGGLIIEYPLINIFKEFGILICYSLSVTDKSKAVGIVVIDRLYVLSLPKKLLVVSVISVAG